MRWKPLSQALLTCITNNSSVLLFAMQPVLQPVLQKVVHLQHYIL
jgi:hypothetical protein